MRAIIIGHWIHWNACDSFRSLKSVKRKWRMWFLKINWKLRTTADISPHRTRKPQEHRRNFINYWNHFIKAKLFVLLIFNCFPALVRVRSTYIRRWLAISSVNNQVRYSILDDWSWFVNEIKKQQAQIRLKIKSKIIVKIKWKK